MNAIQDRLIPLNLTLRSFLRNVTLLAPLALSRLDVRSFGIS